MVVWWIQWWCGGFNGGGMDLMVVWWIYCGELDVMGLILWIGFHDVDRVPISEEDFMVVFVVIVEVVVVVHIMIKTTIRT